MAKEEHQRLTYLIRLWQVRSDGKRVWRGSLEDAHSGAKRGFGDPAGLLAFLQEKLGLKTDPTVDNDSSLSDRVEDHNTEN